MRKTEKLYRLLVSSVRKYGSLKLLKPSGSVQACTEIALPFHKCVVRTYILVSVHLDE